MRRFSLFVVILMSVLGLGLSASAQPRYQKSGTTTPTENVAARSKMIRPMKVSSFRQNSAVRSGSAFNRPAGALKAAGADVPTIYGSLIFSYAWTLDNAAPGMYSFPASDPLTLTMEREGYLAEANGGGTYANNRYYMYYWFEASGAIFNYWRVFDTDTWECLYSERCQEYYVATDLTYDRTTETIYGCYANLQAGGYYFGKSNPSNGSVTVIATLDAPFFTVAADVNGDIYAIDQYGNLLSVDKKTGAQRRLGSTGVVPAYTQSMTFDFKTNRLYWAACTTSFSGLYEINMQTYKASPIGYFDMREEFAGIYIMNQGAANGAPGEIEDFNFEYLPSSVNDIEVTFKMPTLSFDGQALAGNQDWTIRINDVDIDMGSAAPGAEVKTTITCQTGYAAVSVFASNENGAGPEARMRKWVGKDSPVAPGNVKATAEGDKVVVTWDAPTASQHGGYMDLSALNYKVYRTPGDVLVCDGTTGTSFTDETVNTTSLTSYHYRVVAFAGNLAGGSATSNKVLTGNPFEAPYSESFDNYNSWDLFTVLDVNKDGKGWYWDGGQAKSNYTYSADSMDDWLITPMITLKKEDYYRFVLQARTFGYSEDFEVKIGKEATPEAMTTTIIAPTAVNSTAFLEFSGDFIPEEDGIYYIGIHHISPQGRNILAIDEIQLLRAASVYAPDVVEDLTLTPGEKGALSATVSFKVPSKDLIGNDLSSVDEVTIHKGTRIMKKFTGVTPGQELTYIDNGIADPGVVTYKVTAKNEHGNGRESYVSQFVGPDTPGLPINVRCVADADGVLLTWDAPTAGANGGYIEPEKMKYHIQRQNFEIGGVQTVAMNLTTREFRDNPTFETRQGKAAYYVYAVDEKNNVGGGQSSNVAFVGTPYDLPFNESFKGNNASYDTWFFENSKGDNIWGIADAGTYPVCTPADNDGGLVTFEPAESGAESTFISGLIDISKAENPIFEFYYYYNRLSSDEITALVSTNGYEYKEVGNVKFDDLSGTSSWHKLSASLADYKTPGRIQIAIRVKAGKDMANIHIDNITVRDMPARDLGIKTFTTPAIMKFGESTNFGVEVENLGAETAASYTVALCRGGEEVATQTGSNLAPFATAAFTFSQTADHSFKASESYYAKVTFEGDRNASNDKSAEQTVAVSMPTYPTVEDLSGVHNADEGTVDLTWSAPDRASTKEITDGFESYQSFAINNIGDWLTVDKDGSYTVIVGNAEEWPNAGMPQAYIVFNAAKAGLDQPYSDGSPSMFLAHDDSQQMLIAFAGDTEGVLNDDWLISPRLSGKAQTITMYVKSLTEYYGADEFEVYSTTATVRENISDFTKVRNVGGQVPEEWTKISFNVKEGTTYFAIRCVSNNTFGFCVDDITYQPYAEPVVLQGYNVYCNNVKLNDVPFTETSFRHTGVDGAAKNYYNVVCVYDKGESAYSNTFGTEATGVEEVAAGAVKVSTSKGRLFIQGAAGSDYTVTNLQGVNVAAGTAAQITALPLDEGVYVVTVGQNRYKVIVK